MDLFYNQQKISQLPITGETTIGQIKKTLHDWLAPQGITSYSIRIFFSNGTELSNVVFQTNTYDASNLQAQAQLLLGGSIHINTQPAQAPAATTPVSTVPVADVVTKTGAKTTKARQFEASENLYLIKYNDEYKIFRTESDAYEWLLEEILDGGVDLDELGLTEPVDFDDENVQETITEYVEANGDNIAPDVVDLLE